MLTRSIPISTLLDPIPESPAATAAATDADRLAAQHIAANLAALDRLQPIVADLARRTAAPFDWVFARDGSLTARDEFGWWADCSVPLLAGRQLLKTLDLLNPVGCFLRPDHAGQIRAAFELLKPTQALIAIIPDPLALAVILHTHDFSPEISHGRLLFAAGWDWPDRLTAIFTEFPGLPTPRQFVRTATLPDSDLELFSRQAEPIIAAVATRRAERISLLRSRAQRRTPSNPPRILVAAGGQFRIQDLTGPALRTALLQTSNFSALDPDSPISASPLALAEAARDADGLVIADVFRSDLPNTVASRIPWITWVTTARIAKPSDEGPADRILIANPAQRPQALAAGWKAAQISIAAWPSVLPPRKNPPGPAVALFVNAPLPTAIPLRVKQFSTHVLLWNDIADELQRNPLAVGYDPQKYLEDRMGRRSIRDDALDPSLFVEKLILPAYTAGLARLLTQSGIQLAIFDSRTTPEELTAGLDGCRAIVEALPISAAQALAHLGLPILSPAAILSSNPAPRRIPPPADPPLTPQSVLAAIGVT